MSSLENVDLNVEVKLTHSLEDRLAGVNISFDVERGVLTNHLSDRLTEFLRSGFVFRRNRDRDNGIRKYHWLKCGRILWITKGVTGLHVFQTDEGNNVASLSAVEFLARVRMHLHNTTDTLGLTGEGVEDGVTLIQFAGVNAVKVRAPYWSSMILKASAAQRAVRIHFSEARRSPFLRGQPQAGLEPRSDVGR